MRCTCAGTAPGYPQHEDGCGQPEPEETDPFIDLWQIAPCPRCRWLPELHAGPCLPVNGENE